MDALEAPISHQMEGIPESDNTWEDTDQIHAPNLIKLYHQNNPLQKIKGRLCSL